MSNETLEDDLIVPDALTSLKSRADLLGVSYHPSIGVEKLREKIAAAMSGSETKNADEKSDDETEDQKRQRQVQEASKLVRIRLTCMNPFKKDWEGEFFTVGNSVVGSFTKYVPFNSEDGWHVPQIMYNHILERQSQIFVTRKTERGVTVREGKLIKEFAVEVLPQLTREELDELARRQAMAGGLE